MQGIYLIKCTQEDKVYIGSSVDIQKRWGEHRTKLNKERHHNKELQIAWDAYGDESFVFDVLEETEELILSEQKYLDTYKEFLYNSSHSAHNPQRNPEIVEKIRETMFKKYGTRSKGGKFTESDVLKIIDRLNNGESAITIAESLGVHYSSIYYIKNGKNWSQLHHLINLPKKPRDKVFEWLDQGKTRTEIFELLEGKHDRSTIWNWEKIYKNKKLRD